MTDDIYKCSFCQQAITVMSLFRPYTIELTTDKEIDFKSYCSVDCLKKSEIGEK